MGIKEKLPLINSGSKTTRILGYITYFFVGLIILGAILPTPHTVTTAETQVPAEKTLDKYEAGSIIGYNWGFDKWNISVQGNNSNGYILNVVMEAPKDDIWSNEKFLRDTTETFTKIFEKGFEDKRINGIILTQNLNFNDQYGDKQDLPAVSVAMTRSTANKITNWGNFYQLVEIDYNNLFEAADYHTVSPPLLRDS